MAMCGQELEQMSSVDQGSQYSLSDGILPSLGAASRNHRKPKLRRFIISPFDPHYKSLSQFSNSASAFCMSMCSLKWVDDFFSWGFNLQDLAVVSDMPGVLHSMGVSL